ncbi:UNVERIFIED_CONTAM: hypothetical protein RMT77_005966 [Armadillidium vulgare]
MQQIQPQVTTVAYPTPRALAPPGSFSSQGAPVNLAGNLNNSTMQSAAIVAAGGPPSGTGVTNSGTGSQPPQKQRVFTGVITKLCADFGFVDEDVFFQTSCVKGPAPKVSDRVLVEASYNSNMPFKWNANRVQVIPGPINSSGPSSSRTSGPREPSRNVSFNAVPPPNFVSDSQNSSAFPCRSSLGQRPRSPRRDRREDNKRGSRDRPDREDKDKELKRESRKRSRSRDRSRSPLRRRARLIPRYNVQVPKIMLHMKEANVLELRKRYSNLYVPSDVFLARPLWSETFPAHRAFQFPRPVAFHIMNKEVEPISNNDAVYDPPDINHSYAAKVMLMAVPPLEDIYRRSCALSEDSSELKSCFVHPTRLINFLVGLKGKNETMAIGGYWSPSLDGQNPDKDPNVLIQTAIRTCKALTGVDLSGCTTWYRFAEIYYRRGESSHKGRLVPARVETTVLFLPDVWNICPTKLEWDGLHLSYRHQLELRLFSNGGVQQQGQGQQQSQSQQQSQQQQQPQTLEQDDQEEEEGEDKEAAKKDPTHWANLDPKTMKVLELRSELDARLLNSKGLKSQLIARLTKALKVEQEKEEQEKLAASAMDTDELQKKDEEEKKREEEKKKKEEERKKEEEEKRRAEERERSLMEKRYTLPEQPMVVVHPSRTAKSGKFDCTTMSLSVLLDYRQEDNKEHSFEVSLFAELFNEMLMRDFSFRIYKALIESPDKSKDEKREKEKDREKKDEKDDKEEDKKKKDEKEKEEEKDDKKNEKKTEKEEVKEEKEVKKEEFEEDEDMEEEFEEEIDEEDSKDGNKTVVEKEKEREKEYNSKDKRKDDRKDSRETRREKKEKRKMTTIDPHLLLSFVYFDQTHTGYIIDKDLEDIINILGLNLSRAQLKKLMSKVLSRDVLYYRKLTDISAEEKNKLSKDVDSSLDLEQLAKGNNHMLPLFMDSYTPSSEKASRKSPRNSTKEEPVITSTGVVKYEGSLVDIGKLMQQLERSERARSDTEEKLKELQKDLSQTKDESKKLSEKNVRAFKDIKNLQSNLKTMDEELRRVQEDNSVYQRALNQIKSVIRPLVVDVDEEDPSKDEVKIKVERIEGSKNGFTG